MIMILLITNLASLKFKKVYIWAFQKDFKCPKSNQTGTNPIQLKSITRTVCFDFFSDLLYRYQRDTTFRTVIFAIQYTA